MLPKTHAILGLIFSIIIYFMFQINLFQAFLIFFASVFIDFDHYLWYVCRKKGLNPFISVRYFKEKKRKYLSLNPEERNKYKKPLLIFHGIEFILILFILSFFNGFFIFIIIGIIFHLILDYIELIHLKEPLYIKSSQILVFIKNQKKKDYFF